MQSRDFFEAHSELLDALLFRQICFFLISSAGEICFVRVQKFLGGFQEIASPIFTIHNSQALIDKKYVIKLKQICFFLLVQNALCLHLFVCLKFLGRSFASLEQSNVIPEGKKGLLIVLGICCYLYLFLEKQQRGI